MFQTFTVLELRLLLSFARKLTSNLNIGPSSRAPRSNDPVAEIIIILRCAPSSRLVSVLSSLVCGSYGSKVLTKGSLIKQRVLKDNENR